MSSVFYGEDGMASMFTSYLKSMHANVARDLETISTENIGRANLRLINDAAKQPEMTTMGK